MKRFGLALGIVLLASALTAGGYWIGFRQRVLTESYAIATTDKVLADAAVTAMLIQQIDEGRSSDAREHLQLKLAGNILAIDALLDSSDKRSCELAQKVFARIASYRTKNPASPAGTPLIDPEIDAKIASILDRAKSDSSKQ